MARIERFSWTIYQQAIWQAFCLLSPKYLLKNPVMLVVETAAALASLLMVWDWLFPAQAAVPLYFSTSIVLLLWFTLLFANFAESLAQNRGKAQTAALRSMRQGVMANRVVEKGLLVAVEASTLVKNDVVVVNAGEYIPADGEIIEGIASVDESAITGESAPVIRESGGDRSSVTGGTRVLSDSIVVKVGANAGESFLDKMIALVESASQQKTPNELALHVLLVGLTLVFLWVSMSLIPLAWFFHIRLSVMAVIALLVCLIPTTIGGLITAVGIAGIDRLMQKNVIAKSGRAIEAAGDVTVLLLDKTGTITYGNRMAEQLLPLSNVTTTQLAQAAMWSSLADETPEGRSIIQYVRKNYSQVLPPADEQALTPIAFSAHTRMSGIELPNGDSYRKGAKDAVKKFLEASQAAFPEQVEALVGPIADAGGTPLLVLHNLEVLGVIYLKDVVKVGIFERFSRFRVMGIHTIMVTGDNPRTAAAIAKEAGVDEFIAEATPEAKMTVIRSKQQAGHLVAMTGDGTNDAPALAQADVGVAMNSGTQAAKEAGNMMDLDSDPTKLLEVVEVGKQLLMTRGALTTFSLANDVAKYFVILPAMFAKSFPQLQGFDLLHLHSPYSAMLSAVTFNALIIILLIPLALRGVPYRALKATELLKRSLLVYGVGGVITPFVGIKCIDWCLAMVLP